MAQTVFVTWLALYTIPFSAFIATPDGRSLLVVTVIAGSFLGFLGAAIVGVPSAQQGWGHDVAAAWVAMMVTGAGAGFVARCTTLARGWPRLRSFGLPTTILAFAAAPICFAVTQGYDRWQRRPPSAECLARSSFDVAIGAKRLTVPNWPIVMISDRHEHFALSIPSSLRQLCERTSTGAAIPADRATFFFNEVTVRPEWSVLKTWLARICTDAAGDVATSIVCGERPIDQLTIVARTGVAPRTTVGARTPSRSPPPERQAGDQLGSDEGRRHTVSVAYPDGRWAFDDGTTVQCHRSANKDLSCMGGMELADDTAAKVTFPVRGDNVESVWAKVRSMTERFQADVLHR